MLLPKRLSFIMNKNWLRVAIFLLMFATACKRDHIATPPAEPASGYPDDIAAILKTKCTQSTCHNSTDLAGQLDLSTWEGMFRGSDAGAVVIPFRPDYSTLMYFVNIYSDLGPVTTNMMPKGGDALTRAEIIKLKDWITAGASDKKGKIKWADNPNRKKYYVMNQGCRVVTVFDAETNLPMRYVDVADASEQNASPHQVRVSPDGQYWYVCMIGGSYIKRFRTSDDGFDGKIFIGNASWNTMTFTPDSKYLFTVDWAVGGTGGKVKKCDLITMQVVDSTFLADAPHASCASPDGQFVYISATAGNYVYKINVDSLSKPASYDYIDFNGMGPTPSSQYNPHDIVFSPDGTKYYVSCAGNNNVGDLSIKIFDASNDNLITSVALPSGGYEISISSSRNLLFVTSYDGTSQYPNGQAMVVDLSNNTFSTSIETGVQPHGIAVDDAAGLVYVANRNLSNTNPPHHTSVCGGVNGTITYIDLATLSLLDKQVIVSRDPYFISIRH